MKNLTLPFVFNGINRHCEMVGIKGTPAGRPFIFGNPGEEQPVNLPGFYIAKYQTTQAFWNFITGEESGRFMYPGDEQPAEHVSWYDAQDFISKLNQQHKGEYEFRLPTEMEWEYAARGGPDWSKGFRFAGIHTMDDSGWYEGNAGPYTDLQQIARLNNRDKLTTAHPVGKKQPNTAGLYDMNGNLWEWCQDGFVRDTSQLPGDGTAYSLSTGSKVLRGGCHHNGAVHCTNTLRYEIPPDSYDGCIGFRIALTLPA